ncbi:MAG TPA: hypothetical protein VM537_08620 [Anaerolineae bacterium]|nr:hypothetical protein [Anaerolineae bacterium]
MDAFYLLGFGIGLGLGCILWPLFYWLLGLLFWCFVGGLLVLAAGVGRLQRDPVARRLRAYEKLRRSVQRGYSGLVPLKSQTSSASDSHGDGRDFYCWRCLKVTSGVQVCRVMVHGLWQTICSECFETFYVHEERVP